MLPAPGSKWPPPAFETPHRDIAGWSAWFSGDPERLSRHYGGSQTTAERSWAQRGGLAGAVQRFFWGQQTDPGQQRTKLHVPTAADIAAVSADLLFGASPKITVEDETTQERLDVLLGEHAQSRLHEAAEVCAALGHTYLRVGWDYEVDDSQPLLSVVDADAAFPVYRYGRLMEVTFVREWCEGSDVYRHLEHHSRGLIEHALYLGDHTNLGRPVPLADRGDTAMLADGSAGPGSAIQQLADGRQGIVTGLDMLTVVGVANAPTRTWRNNPAARDLGRADIAGVEPVLDALDDSWSSWMRDLRHGRSRLHVPQHMLESQGRGKGAIADIDRELYVGLQTPPDGQLQLEATQFAIRYAEHSATTLALLKEAVSGAGYSPQTFGLETDAALTATESWARQKRSRDTRAAKIRRWRPALIDLVRLMLAVDRQYFRGQGDPDKRADVLFPDVVSESQLTVAQTAGLWRSAEAASTETIVKLLHSDWDDALVQEEVTKIEDEQAAAMPAPFDPASGTVDPNADPHTIDQQSNPADQQAGDQPSPGLSDRMGNLDWGLFGG